LAGKIAFSTAPGEQRRNVNQLKVKETKAEAVQPACVKQKGRNANLIVRQVK